MIKWSTVSPPLKESGYLRGKVGDLTLFTIEMNPIHKKENLTKDEVLIYGKKYILKPLIGCFNIQNSDSIDELKEKAENMVLVLVNNLVKANN